MERKLTVSIFSRSSRKDSAWLMSLLESRDLVDLVAGVTFCFITNNGSAQFIEEVSCCSFGILYHTKNRGRINITDVDGALYDDELQMMQELLGRENVMVVVDDLEDSSDEEKKRILQSQPSIQERAGHLLLISQSEKANPKMLETKLKTHLSGPAVGEETLNGSKTQSAYEIPEAKIEGENSKTRHGKEKIKTLSNPTYLNIPEISDTAGNQNYLDNNLEEKRSPSSEATETYHHYEETSSGMEGPEILGTEYSTALEICDTDEDSETEHIYENP